MADPRSTSLPVGRPALIGVLIPIAVYIATLLWMNEGSLGGALTWDDAYIYLAAAQNFHEHGVFAVSPFHAPMAGLTAPPWVMLLALGTLALDPVVLARALGVAGGALSLLLCFALVSALCGASRLRVAIASAGTTALALNRSFSLAALGGMETSVFLALALLLLWTWALRGPGLLTGCVAAVVATMRPDGPLLPGILFMLGTAAFVRAAACDRVPRLHALLRYAIPVAVLVVVQAGVFLHYLGRPNSNSVVTRSLVRCETAGGLAARAEKLGSALALHVEGDFVLLALAAASLPLLLVRLPRATADPPLRVGLVLLGLGYVAAFFGLFPSGPAYQGGRYFLPTVGALFVLASLTLRDGVVWLERWGSRGKLLAAFLLCGFVACAVLGPLQARRDAARFHLFFVKANKSYQQNLEWVETHTDPNARVGVTDLGHPLYYLDQEVFDLIGLANPEMLPYYGDPATGTCLPFADRDLSGVPERFGLDLMLVHALWWHRLKGLVQAPGLERVDVPFGMLQVFQVERGREDGS